VSNPALYARHLQVEVTKRCNLQCLVCAAASSGRGRAPDLTLDAFKRIIDQIPTLETLTINGVGESFLNGDFLDMVEYARSKKIFTRFITNMTKLPDDAPARLVKAGVDEIIVSMDSADPELFADMRRGARLDVVMDNIRKINAAKKSAGSSKPEVKVHAVLLRRALPHIPHLVETLKTLDINHLTFVDFNVSGVNLDRTFRDGGRLYEECLANNMSEREIWAEIEKIRALSDDSFTIVTPGEYGGLKGVQRRRPGVMTCMEMWDSPFITCDGHVTPCCWISHQGLFDLGNIHEKSFEEIWFGKGYYNLRKQHILNRHHPYCRMCQQLVLTIAEPRGFKSSEAGTRRFTKSFLFK
jgi:radical SAM protein with 4Fe4S-binding SPASM domain